VTNFFPNPKGAIFSPCGTYRYALWRIWSPALPLLMILGLNPSRAGADKNDQTIRREIDYAARWSFGGLLKGNLFGFVDTHQSNLRDAPDRVGPDNDLWLMRMRERAGEEGMFLAAWGACGDLDPDRVAVVRAMFPKLHTLGFTQSGQPKHPLRLAKTLKPILWEEAKAA
jgi:hypothetical protein